MTNLTCTAPGMNANEPTLVSAVIGNWNGASVLPACLRSLTEQTYRPIEVIVVDNASTDASEQVALTFAVRWVAMGRNAGLAAALNQGARKASGQFLLFLNNDMRFDPRFVESLVGELSRRSSAFAADATQYDWEGHARIHTATFLASAAPNATAVEVAPGLRLRQLHQTEPVEVFMASGANMMVRRDLFDSLGGFNAAMFLGYEDLDLCWRARLRGWPIVFVPSAVCWHRESVASSSPEGSPLRLRGTTVGRLLFSTSWLPLTHVLQAWSRALAGLGRDCAMWRWSRARARGRALASALWLLPRLLRERRRAYSGAQKTPATFLRELRQIGNLR